mmetsp:Transcript_95100/g.266281  ORF Transcript_95100/g.266281 Transcript_95100/m.266281 type:complete len:237 (+) Transcript_95100:1238-1948(+)
MAACGRRRLEAAHGLAPGHIAWRCSGGSRHPPAPTRARARRAAPAADGDLAWATGALATRRVFQAHAHVERGDAGADARAEAAMCARAPQCALPPSSMDYRRHCVGKRPREAVSADCPPGRFSCGRDRSRRFCPILAPLVAVESCETSAAAPRCVDHLIRMAIRARSHYLRRHSAKRCHSLAILPVCALGRRDRRRAGRVRLLATARIDGPCPRTLGLVQPASEGAADAPGSIWAR